MLARMDNFVPIPTNLIYMLDCDCLKVLAILIQKESYWDNKGKLKDGWFVKSISELKAELGCANTKDVGCIIQALVNSGIIEVTAYEKKGMAAKFKICWNKVNELNGMSDTWGTKLHDDVFEGPNLLGRVLMELRDKGSLTFQLPEDTFDFVRFLP